MGDHTGRGHVGKKVYGGLCRKRLHVLRPGKRRCIECANERKKQYRLQDSEKFRHRARERYQTIRISKPHQPREAGWRRQGIQITYNEFLALLEKQNYECAICADSIGRSAAVDHDHKTGCIRGALCSSCNHGIGKFHEDVALLRRAIAYLEV